MRLPDGSFLDVVYIKPRPEEYSPSYPHQVVVTELTRHGRAKRLTFVRRSIQRTGPGRWRSEPPSSLKSAKHEIEQMKESGKPIRGRAGPPLKAGETVLLCSGVQLPATMLAAILDACASAARHYIDIAEIKTIVSQLGSRITQMETLTEEDRRLAEPALYSEILRRCTNVE